ncbi:hypothetical protein DFR86_07650 [Acidianus sulfidivorans JP7]|uniref:Uncharacterized protein n=1 Tax=Acidianus sulfidivorans JP7 TaxID=619593 RepID=A0A2U9IN56_9CREN|nr:hypothetical protein [Acidianus sulfidivorans]AWR97436.1 hypothetical protein DFR86_07650 [Acidianus sulfidivorans JP7]
MSLFKREETKIYHIDHLPEEMKIAIKTIIDSSIPDVALAYGFRYLYPKLGEPIFIPYGRLDGKYKNSHQAFEKILNEVEKIKNNVETYKQWYGSDIVLYDHYRFTFYSYVDPNEGMTVGIAGEPLSAPGGYFDINEVCQNIKGNAIILNSALAGYISTTCLSKFNVKFMDNISNRKDEIIEAYLWLNQKFHEKYDKDKTYDVELGRTYMQRLFHVIHDSVGKYEGKNNAETAIIPIIVEKYVEGKILNALEENETYKILLNTARYYDISLLPILFSDTPKIIDDAKGKYSRIILIGNKKIPSNLDIQEGKKVVDKDTIKVIDF